MTQREEGRPARPSLVWWGALCACLAAPVPTAAQAPVEDLTARDQAVQRGQQNAAATYRDLQQARHEAKLAEQEFLNAQEAQKAAQKQADERRREMDAAKKALDAARSREAQARTRYEEALGAVDKAYQKPPAKSP